MPSAVWAKSHFTFCIHIAQYCPPRRRQRVVAVLIKQLLGNISNEPAAPGHTAEAVRCAGGDRAKITATLAPLRPEVRGTHPEPGPHRAPRRRGTCWLSAPYSKPCSHVTQTRGTTKRNFIVWLNYLIVFCYDWTELQRTLHGCFLFS